MTKATQHARERRQIDRHFAARGHFDEEVALRNHLAGCADCRAYYDRNSALAALDPAAPAAVERLAAGLGFAAGAVPAWRPRGFTWSWLLVPAAAVVLLVTFRRSDAPPEFGVRAGATTAAPALHAYRVGDAAADELAFAYQNPSGLAHLLVVGLDERGNAYWFYPDPESGERAVPIVASTDKVELPEAIRHDYAGQDLRVFGLFATEALRVGQVRPVVAAVGALGPGAGCAEVAARLPAATCVELRVPLASGRVREGNNPP